MTDTFIDLFITLYNFSVLFQSAFKQCMVMTKQNPGYSHFFGPISRFSITQWSRKNRIEFDVQSFCNRSP